MMPPDIETKDEKVGPDVLPWRLTNCAAWLGALCVMAGFADVFVTCTRTAATACAARGTANVSTPAVRATDAKERMDLANIVIVNLRSPVLLI